MAKVIQGLPTFKSAPGYILSLLLFSLVSVAVPVPVRADAYTDRLKNLAQQYYWGVEKNKDLEKALGLYLEAARRGDNESKYIAGGMYYRGFGAPRDMNKAFRLLYEAAENGNSTIESQKLLGQFFLAGTVVPRNYQEAMKWFSVAAEGGDRDAQGELAFLYFSGKGGELDYQKAFEWYEKSAYQGLAFSQYSLGIMYYLGYGVDETDPYMAYGWISLAAAQNHPNARQAIIYLENSFSQEELLRAQDMAKSLYNAVFFSERPQNTDEKRP